MRTKERIGLDFMKKQRILIVFILLISILTSLIYSVSFGATYNQTVINANRNNNNGIDAFPESYQILLNKLVEKTGHTDWKFEPLYTDISWSELTSTTNENKCLRNTIYKSSTSPYPSTWYCGCGGQGDTGYYCASGRIVNYYLDPRNFLTEKTIFQFLELSNSSSYTKSMVETILADSFMNYNVSGYDYAGDIMDAAAVTGESPLSIAIKIIQEIGRGKNGDGTYYIPHIVSGNDSEYPNTYNFFNYGASDGQGNILRGLAYASNKGWNSRRTAIIEGARLISSSYIGVGQTTKYLFKFDVIGQEYKDLYTHQYMTNIQDPTNQALMLFSTYSQNSLLDESLTFLIPVYKDMPEYIKLPSTLTGAGGQLYYVSSTSDPVGYRSGPGSGYARLGELRKDSLVEMISYNINGSGFSQIRIDSGTIVYMSNEYLTPVNTKKDIYSVPSQPSPENPSTQPNNNFKIEGSNLIAEPKTSLTDLRNAGYTITSVTKNGVDVSGQNLIGTGTIIVTNQGTYTVVKLGDLNGDAEVDVIDLALIKRHLVGSSYLSGIYCNAAKLKGGETEIDVVDLALIKRHLVGSNLISI